MEDPGIFSLIDIEEDEEKLLLDYLEAWQDTENFTLLYNIFRSDFYKFLDVFAGERLDIPERYQINKVIQYIKIYNYCRNRGYSDQSIKMAAKIYNKRKSGVIRSINKVKRVLIKLDED